MYLEFGTIKLWLRADDEGITHIDFIEAPLQDAKLTKMASQHLTLAKEELTAFFNGTIVSFTVPLHITEGTVFQRKVWQALQTIPYGEIRNYQEIAILADSPKAQRAVGQANRKNPIPIIIPCHRVIGKNGKLVGYSGNSPEGIAIKNQLLSLERSTHK
ncbi:MULTISPECIES: methylated-DNA--[protein]-cysteine S-methyltransferase [Vagococcus]|uniref:methylated-DNA--[protein]-cysteine S-methyltransferase n=1 Tax=Vagococcus fluvialis bH819 TaxID=1255619 RepID=A0A1X6WSD9_9ENTE|nr:MULTISPECIES: methylated-DNA--[protein]-cysteine S-methyltransferase [Vagococcus]SLM87198.1 Methylated-DNA--protein-cysteine methyltransferase [Vagococcus fluvialis bH819]HCM90068.1 methylated-DNA--[protein]-cysteine S-methyltransferase [Vagococcus sp.]